MGRTIKRLSGLEIDEVSLVDRPANQHGIVAIAKRLEDVMGIFDADGVEVSEEELGHGDFVYDEDGNEFVFVEDGQEEPADLAEAVGKVDLAAGVKRAGQYARYGRARARRDIPGGLKTLAAAGGGAAAGATGLGIYHAGGKDVDKSLGDQVMESLSKAFTDDDRNEVIAKAMDYMQDVADRNADLEQTVFSMMSDQDAAGFTELAKSYDLPVDPDEIAGIMFRASQALPESDLATLDRLFSSMGEVTKAYYDEIGYSGGYEGSALGEVFAAAGEAVSKSGSAMSQEQAVTALFDANPAAYDEYEAEQRFNR